MSINLVLPYQVCCVLYIDRLVSAPLVSLPLLVRQTYMNS